MIYNFNLGIGWASSGVEYAQAYRAKMFRNIHKKAMFIFTDMMSYENIEHMTKNIGFLDLEVEWLYTFFTDFDIEPVSYTLKDFEKTIVDKSYQFNRNGKVARYIFEEQNTFYTAYMVDEKSDLLHRVEYVSRGYLIRKDYFTSARIFSEYYAPLDNKAHLYHRRFFNHDGSLAYEEVIDDDHVLYKFKDKLLYSKEELIGYMVSKLSLTKKDTVILDRSTQLGQAVLMNCGDAKVGIIVHADHFSENTTNDDVILWNNYYEYDFNMAKHIDFYICSTDAQTKLLKMHFKKYKNIQPKIYTIPVGGLDELKNPKDKRKPFSIITASRLASEKHVDWIIQAVSQAHEVFPELTLDIYGKGGEEKKLKELISELNANEYIHLMGQQDLANIYQNYELYLSASTSEGFGLSLMEAIGAGLPIVGFDVRYGNPTFIRDGKNGYLLPIPSDDTDKIQTLKEGVIHVFKSDLEKMHKESYRIGKTFLTSEVQKRWKSVV